MVECGDLCPRVLYGDILFLASSGDQLSSVKFWYISWNLKCTYCLRLGQNCFSKYPWQLSTHHSCIYRTGSSKKMDGIWNRYNLKNTWHWKVRVSFSVIRIHSNEIHNVVALIKCLLVLRCQLYMFRSVTVRNMYSWHMSTNKHLISPTTLCISLDYIYIYIAKNDTRTFQCQNSSNWYRNISMKEHSGVFDSLNYAPFSNAHFITEVTLCWYSSRVRIYYRTLLLLSESVVFLCRTCYLHTTLLLSVLTSSATRNFKFSPFRNIF